MYSRGMPFRLLRAFACRLFLANVWESGCRRRALRATRGPSGSSPGAAEELEEQLGRGLQRTGVEASSISWLSMGPQAALAKSLEGAIL